MVGGAPKDRQMIALGDLLVLNDALDAVLLGAFFFGLVFTGVSLLIGAADLGGPHVGHGHGFGHGPAHNAGGHDTAVSVFNIATILAFVTWFGGIAYLIRNGLGIPGIPAIIVGLLAGVAGGFIVLRLLQLVKDQATYLDAAKERLGGALGRVTSPIRDGGTGEIVYELNGVRQASAARAAVGTQLPRGAEVIVVRRERGIAFVEPADRLSPDDDWERRFRLTDGVDRAHPPPGTGEKVEQGYTR